MKHREYALIAACLALATLLACLVGCTPRGNFDGWIARQPITVRYTAVPCNNPAFTCGAVGTFDAIHNVIYIDLAVVASIQARQDKIDPSVDVRTMIWYHEWSHAADRAAGFVEGVSALGFEHAAQCGMQLVTGRAYTFFEEPVIYWICPDAELARTRWIWTTKGII